MKKITILFTSLLFTLTLFSPVTVTAEETIYTAMYRLYNPNSGEHFYTADVNERNNLVDVGWTYEGVGWTAPSTSNTPVYRLYNANAGDHHYTIDASERDNLVKVGWKYEGIGWYSDDAKGVPLYRQYNPNAKAGSHNYTTSIDENNYLKSIGWKAEGVGWYGSNHTHNYTVTTAATCTSAGVKTCSCGATQTIAALGHDYSVANQELVTAAYDETVPTGRKYVTCDHGLNFYSADEYNTHAEETFCSGCGSWKNETTTVHHDATYTTYYTCSRCGARQ